MHLIGSYVARGGKTISAISDLTFEEMPQKYHWNKKTTLSSLMAH